MALRAPTSTKFGAIGGLRRGVRFCYPWRRAAADGGAGKASQGRSTWAGTLDLLDSGATANFSDAALRDPPHLCSQGMGAEGFGGKGGDGALDCMGGRDWARV